MRYTYAVEELAKRVYDSLNIPADLYKSFDLPTAEEFKSHYLSDTSYLRSMVADELHYMNLDMEPNRQAEFIEDVELEVSDMIEDNLRKYVRYQHRITDFEFKRVFQAIQTCAAEPGSNIEHVDVEHDPEYDYKRTITLILDNGATITMNVEFEEDYDLYL